MTRLVFNPGPHIVSQLEDELQLARDRIKELEAALGVNDDLAPYRAMGFTPQEAAVLNLLARRLVVTKEQALQAMYAKDPERRFDVMPKILDTIACHLRKKLRRLGVEFETLPGSQGYRILSKSRLQSLVASRAALLADDVGDRRQRVNRAIAAQRRQRASNGVFTRAAE